MNVLYNDAHTAYAVLVSHGYGIDWSAYNSALAYDERVVRWYLSLTTEDIKALGHYDSPQSQKAKDFFHDLGYDVTYFGGIVPNMIEWVPVGIPWRIHEYDGAESIEFYDKDDWVCFNG